MDTFEIKDEEIDVEDIMQKIKDNVKKRRESGEYTKEMDALVNEPLLPPPPSAGEGDLQSDLNYINSNWDVHVEYSITTHRPIFGRFLVWTRRVIHGEVKRYADLIVGKQNEFNVHLVRVLNNIRKEQKVIDEKVSNIFTTVNKDIENKTWLANMLEKKIETKRNLRQDTDEELNKENINYFIFKENIGKAWNKISGSFVQGVPNIFDDSLNLFNGCKTVLEIGCGEGIFLQMLKDKGIKGYGIEVNEDFVLYCKRKDLDVKHVDALTHLSSIEDKTLDGVFAAHVIEHIPLKELERLIELCYAKMQFGSHIVLVTPNILNMTVSTNTFYMDPTHLNHLHPDVMKFLLESCGFRDVQQMFYQPVPEEMKLKKIDLDPDGKMNYNIDILNNLLFGYRDFAVIAKK